MQGSYTNEEEWDDVYPPNVRNECDEQDLETIKLKESQPMASLFFTHPLCGTLLIDKNGEKSLIDIDLPRDSHIFKAMEDSIREGGFDYFYYKDILMISDVSTSIKGLLPVSECQIEGMKEIWIPFCEWVLFLTYNEVTDSAWLVNSLNLPDKVLVRKGLQFRKRKDLNLFLSGKEDSEIHTIYSDIEKLK